MYTQYFGLKEKPFAIAPDPRYLYMSELHREAFAHLLYGIGSDGCLILLTGDVGTGKTTVSRCLIEQLPDKTDIAIILNPILTITELLKTICEELNISVAQDSSSGKVYIDSLNRYLLDAHAKGRSTALLIDEAQNLDTKVLEQLRLLTNLETNTHKLLQIILLGQPEFCDKLNSPQLSQINQRITSRYHLQPLKSDEVGKYIRHRITIAGGSDVSLFSPGAVKHIVKISKGIPRIINILCDRGLLGAYAEDKHRVGLKIIKKAAREISSEIHQPSISLRRLTLALLLILLGVCLPTGYYFFNRAPLPLLSPQSKEQQTIKQEPVPQKEAAKQTQQRVIVINPVHYDTDLKEDSEPAPRAVNNTTDITEEQSAPDGPENHRRDSSEIRTSEID